ncbi:MAG: HD domain-containing protein [Prevotella sp.]|nr:HD domain-containing protein [Prevotella sp.]
MPTTPTDRKRLFCQLLKSTKRKNVDAVITEIERLGFFDALGSSTEHNAIPGGLLIHSLNVYHVATKIAQDMHQLQPDFSILEDSLIIVSLLHDICKAPRYLNAKCIDGKYQKNYSHLPVGHGEKSVIMLLRLGFELTDDEIIAIRWHMAPWQLTLTNTEMVEDFRHAELTCPLLPILQSADRLAAKIMEVKPKL